MTTFKPGDVVITDQGDVGIIVAVKINCESQHAGLSVCFGTTTQWVNAEYVERTYVLTVAEMTTLEDLRTTDPNRDDKDALAVLDYHLHPPRTTTFTVAVTQPEGRPAVESGQLHEVLMGRAHLHESAIVTTTPVEEATS